MKSSPEVEKTAAASAQSGSAEGWSQLAHRELVRRIVVSPTFAKSERLCALLTYVCDISLKGRAAEINEQRIGHAVFGRSLDYDSSVDGIVRTQASRLRQRLETYYQREGASDPVRVLIPRGSYVPQFVTHAPQKSPSQEETTVEAGTLQAGKIMVAEAASAATRGRTGTIALLTTSCVLLLVAFAVLLVHQHSLQSRLAMNSQAFSHPLWSKIFVAGQPTLEVPGDSGLVLFHRFQGRTVTLNEYMTGEYRNPGPYTGHEIPTDASTLESDFANRRYTSIVDLNAAVAFTRFAQQAHSSLQVRYARDVRPNDLKSGNLILFGAAEANPWVELLEKNMNFSLHNDYKTHVFTVRNRSPRPGEPAQWASATNDPEHRVYGIIGYLPSLSGSGKTLVIEGTSMAGCEAALDFMLDDARLLPVLSRMHRADKDLPSFELLVTTENAGASAIRSNLVAIRTYE